MNLPYCAYFTFQNYDVPQTNRILDKDIVYMSISINHNQSTLGLTLKPDVFSSLANITYRVIVQMIAKGHIS